MEEGRILQPKTRPSVDSDFSGFAFVKVPRECLRLRNDHPKISQLFKSLSSIRKIQRDNNYSHARESGASEASRLRPRRRNVKGAARSAGLRHRARVTHTSYRQTAFFGCTSFFMPRTVTDLGRIYLSKITFEYYKA